MWYKTILKVVLKSWDYYFFGITSIFIKCLSVLDPMLVTFSFKIKISSFYLRCSLHLRNSWTHVFCCCQCCLQFRPKSFLVIPHGPTAAAAAVGTERFCNSCNIYIATMELGWSVKIFLACRFWSVRANSVFTLSHCRPWFDWHFRLKKYIYA